MKWTKEKAIEEYRAIRQSHGDKAKSTKWMYRNGYGGLLQYSCRIFKGWHNFKKRAGFDDEPFCIYWSPELAIKTYREARIKFGDKAKSSNWIIKNGYCGLFNYVVKAFKSWSEFKKQSGFNDNPLHVCWTNKLAISEYKKALEKHVDMAKSSSWMYKNGYSKLCDYVVRSFGSWTKFLYFYYYTIGNKKSRVEYKRRQKAKKQSVKHAKEKSARLAKERAIRKWTKEKAIKSYREIRKEQGEKARSCEWIITHGYSGLYRFISNKLKLRWDSFKEECGFKDAPLKKKLTLAGVIDEYVAIREKYGDKASSSGWIIKNLDGGQVFMGRVGRLKFGGWNKFKDKAGFKDEPFYRTGMSRETLVKEYSKIRKKYGSKARGSRWMADNGFGWIESKAKLNYGLKWNMFIEECGFKDGSLRKGIFSRKELIKKYREIRSKYGDKSGDVNWLKNNGYLWLYGQATRRLTKRHCGWLKFKKEAGFDDRYSSATKNIKDKETITTGCRKLLGQYPVEIPIDLLIEQYRVLRNKYGEMARTAEGLTALGYGWLKSRISKSGIEFWRFKKIAGYHNETTKRKIPLSLGELLDEYRVAIKNFGDNNSKRRDYLDSHGYKWLTKQVVEKHRISWARFITLYSYKTPDKELRINI